MVGIVRIQKRIHQPELHILYVALLEIGIVKLAHDAAPPAFRIQQRALLVYIIGVEIIRSAFRGIKRQIQSLHSRRLTVGELTAGENLHRRHLTHIRIAQLIHIALDIRRTQRRIALCEKPVDIIPVKQRPILSIIHIIAQRGFREKSRRRIVIRSRRKLPCVGRAQVYARLCRLEIVHIARSLA